MSSLRKSYARITNNELSILLRDMTRDGDPAGDHDANVNGSVAPVEFFITPLPDTAFEIVQTGIEISDVGNTALNDYGGVVGPLTNGIQFFLKINGVKFDILNPIRSNRELINLGPTVQRSVFTGNTAVNTYSFNTWEHARMGQILNGDSGDQFGVRIQDDLTTLLAHTIVVKGNIRFGNY